VQKKSPNTISGKWYTRTQSEEPNFTLTKTRATVRTKDIVMVVSMASQPDATFVALTKREYRNALQILKMYIADLELPSQISDSPESRRGKGNQDEEPSGKRKQDTTVSPDTMTEEVPKEKSKKSVKEKKQSKEKEDPSSESDQENTKKSTKDQVEIKKLLEREMEESKLERVVISPAKTTMILGQVVMFVREHFGNNLHVATQIAYYGLIIHLLKDQTEQPPEFEVPFLSYSNGQKFPLKKISTSPLYDEALANIMGVHKKSVTRVLSTLLEAGLIHESTKFTKTGPKKINLRFPIPHTGTLHQKRTKRALEKDFAVMATPVKRRKTKPKKQDLRSDSEGEEEGNK